MMGTLIIMVLVALAVAVLFRVSASKRPCPHCRTMMPKSVSACPHCHKAIPLGY
jgi:hypothetical protein